MIVSRYSLGAVLASVLIASAPSAAPSALAQTTSDILANPDIAA